MDCNQLLMQAKQSLSNDEYNTLRHLMNKAITRYEYDALCKDIESRKIAIPTKLVERKLQLEVIIFKHQL